MEGANRCAGLEAEHHPGPRGSRTCHYGDLVCIITQHFGSGERGEGGSAAGSDVGQGAGRGGGRGGGSTWFSPLDLVHMCGVYVCVLYVICLASVSGSLALLHGVAAVR